MSISQIKTANTPDCSNARNIGYSVALLDSNPALSMAISQQLSDSIGVACTGFCDLNTSLFELIDRHRPHLVILDPDELDLSAENDIMDVVRQVHSASPETRLLAYCNRMDSVMLQAAIQARFRGCVGKRSELRQLALAIQAIQSGGVYFDPCFVPHLRPLIGQGGCRAGILSARELDVVTRTAKGQSAKHIALTLDISAKTVETYKFRAQQKLGIKDRAGLVDYALSNGLLT